MSRILVVACASAGPVGQLSRQRLGRPFQLVVRDDAGRRPIAAAGGVDVATEDQQLRRPAEPDQAGEQVGGAHVRAGQADLREEERELGRAREQRRSAASATAYWPRPRRR